MLGLSGGRRRYRQILITQNAVAIDVDDAEQREDGALLEDLVHVMAMPDLRVIGVWSWNQEQLQHDVHRLREERHPEIVLREVAPGDGVAVGEERDLEEVSVVHPVLRESIDYAVVLRKSEGSKLTSTMRMRK